MYHLCKSIRKGWNEHYQQRHVFNETLQPHMPSYSSQRTICQSWLLDYKHVMPVATNFLADQALRQTDRHNWIPHCFSQPWLSTLLLLYDLYGSSSVLNAYMRSCDLIPLRHVQRSVTLHIPLQTRNKCSRRSQMTRIMLYHNNHGQKLGATGTWSWSKEAEPWGQGQWLQRRRLQQRTNILWFSYMLQKSGAGTAFHKRNKHSHPSDTAWSSLFHSPISSVSGLQGLLVLLFT